MLGNNDGTFQSANLVDTLPGPSNPIAIAAADLNRDGNLDLVVSNSGDNIDSPTTNGSILVYLGNGDGTIQAAKSLNTGLSTFFRARSQWRMSTATISRTSSSRSPLR
jgi:hypothetical protein